MAEFSIDAQIACVRRELAFRRNVYRLKVGRGAMPQSEADHEIGCMEAVLMNLIKLKPAGDMLPGMEDKPCPT